MPLGHWNRKWNHARSNYSTYKQELLAGMLALSWQFRLLGTKPIVCFCDQEPVTTLQKGTPPEKANLKQWCTYLSQFRLTVHRIQGINNEMADYISRNNFDALLPESSEALAKEAFQRMDVQLNLSMRTAGVLEGWSLKDYQSEYQCVPNSLSDGLEARLIDGKRWYNDNQCLYTLPATLRSHPKTTMEPGTSTIGPCTPLAAAPCTTNHHRHAPAGTGVRHGTRLQVHGSTPRLNTLQQLVDYI